MIAFAEHLRALAAAEGGSLSVERYLREALFHPRWGYYAAGRAGLVGRRGDFSTAATLHPVLGQAVGAWAWHHRTDAGNRLGRWHVIELGGGSGQLAAAFLQSLGVRRRLGLRYHLVEISPGLREEQRARLRPWTGRVSWHNAIGDALRAAGRQALIFSNEFVDAFPCIQLVRDRRASQGWREARLAWTSGSDLPTELISAADIGAPTLDAAAENAFADGARIEVHRAYAEWLAESLAPHWRAGRLLTIDYGDTFPALYHRRPRGTLRAYFRHVRMEPGDPEVFARPGRQDLTSDVNFTDLQRWGAALGFREGAPLCTLDEFLRRWSPRPNSRLEEAGAALLSLLDPSGAGGAFRVLEQIPAQPLPRSP